MDLLLAGLLVFAAPAAVLARAVRRRQDRGAWLALTVALAASACGGTLPHHGGTGLAFPAAADLALLVSFPAVIAAGLLFARARLTRVGPALALDLTIGTLGAAAVWTCTWASTSPCRTCSTYAPRGKWRTSWLVTDFHRRL